MPTAEQNPTSKQKKSPKGAIIGAIVVLCALLIAAGIGVSTHSRNQEPASREAASANTAASSATASSGVGARSSKAATESEAASDKATAADDATRAKRIEAFERVLAGYQAADRARDANASSDSPLPINIEAMQDYVLDNELVYAYYDIAGDGSEELLIARRASEGDTILYELAGYDAAADSVKHIGSFTGYRSYCTVCDDGILLFSGSGGAHTGEYSAMELPANSTDPVLVEQVNWDFEGNFDNVKYWRTDADGNESECGAEEGDRLLARYTPIESFDWQPVASLDFGEEAEGGNDTTSAHEETAKAFAMQYYTNATVSSNDDTQVENIDNWQQLVQAYFEPDSAASQKFYEEIVSSPLGGLGAGCIATNAEVISSDGHTIVVNVSYCGTQNPMPGWTDPAKANTFALTCTVNDRNLIESYDMSTTPASSSGGENANGSGSGSEAADPEYTIATKSFTVVVPEYWRGKVSWDVETDANGEQQVRFYPSNVSLDPRPNFPVVRIWAEDLSATLNRGDYIAHVAGVVEGATKRVCVSTVNYAADRAVYFYNHPNYGGSSQDDELYETLYDLQFGGNLPLSPREAARKASDIDEAPAAFLGLDIDFVEKNVVPMIRDVA